jgi:hypothetical protein
MAYNNYDADDKTYDLTDLGGLDEKPLNHLTQTEFPLKQFAKRTVQANYSVFNKWKKVWVFRLLEKKHRSMIWEQNRLKPVRDGPMHLAIVVADCIETSEDWLPLDTFDNAQWNRRQWGQIVLKKCASKIREVRKKGRRGNMLMATDVSDCASKQARRTLPEVPITTFMVVIGWVSNRKDMALAQNPLQTL